MKNKKGFTFIETLVVIGIVAILATTVVVAVNPTRRFEDARDKQREIHLQTILSAIERKTTIEAGWFDEEKCAPLPQGDEGIDEETGLIKPIFKTIGNKRDVNDTEKLDPNFYDLFDCLVPKYMVNELYDPDGGSATDTHYQIWQNPQTKYVTLRYVKEDPYKEIVAGAKKYFALRIPTVTTAGIKNITHTWAESGGNVTDDGGSSVSESGVVWHTHSNPTYTDNIGRTVDSSGISKFNSTITGLTSNTTYYVRAYARNDIGVGYGEEPGVSFNTPDLRPVVETLTATDVTDKTAVLQGKILTLGLAPVTAYFCWGENISGGDDCPVSNQKPADEPGATAIKTEPFSFSAVLSGLTKNITYSFKACGRNSGDRCGDIKSFTPTESAPYIVTIYPATNITSDSADAWGDVVSDGGLTILERGICYSQTVDPKHEDWDDEYVFCKPVNGTTGKFSASITGLNPNTTYNFRAYAKNGYAKNGNGLSHGERKQFTTIKTAPKVTTQSATRKGVSSADTTIRIDSTGGETINQWGVCWLPSPQDPSTLDPTKSANCTKETSWVEKNQSYNSSILVYPNGLWANTTYNVKAYAINIKGTGWDNNSVTLGTDSATNPTLSTVEPPTEITMTSAKLKGNVTDHGGAKISGTSGIFKICYSLSASNIDPKIGGQGVIGCPSLLLPSNLGEFTIKVTGLIPSTSYHYQAYVKNEAGKDKYGGAKSFETLASEPPTVETIHVADSGGNWAKIKGQVKTTGGYADTKRGICYKTLESDATCIEDTGVGVGDFWVTTLPELELDTTYYAFAFAYNNPEEKVYDLTPIQFELKICQKYTDGVRVNIPNTQDLFGQCTPGTTASDGCRSDFCSGTGASCGILTAGDGGCPTCKTCVGATSFQCVNINNTQDTTSPGTCSGICEVCQNGTCGVADAGSNPGGKCSTTGCYTGYCKGGVKECQLYAQNQEGNCPKCQYCNGVSANCQNMSNYGSDSIGTLTCAGKCSGYCLNGTCTSNDTGFGNCYTSTQYTTASEGDGMCAGGTCIAGTRYYLYITNILYTGLLYGRTGADSYCDIDVNKPTGSTGCTRSGWAFISSGDYSIADFPARKSIVPSFYWWWKIGNGSSLQAATSFNDLLDYSIVNHCPLSSSYWTGSNSNGTLHLNNCNYWQKGAGSPSAFGIVGWGGFATGGWLAQSSPYCGNSYSILCACLGI